VKCQERFLEAEREAREKGEKLWTEETELKGCNNVDKSIAI